LKRQIGPQQVVEINPALKISLKASARQYTKLSWFGCWHFGWRCH